MIKNENYGMIDFIFYTFFIIISCSIFLLSVGIKNEINETQLDIRKLNSSFFAHSDEVKSLQSSRNYFTSYEYIQKTLKKRMVSVTPETLLISISEWENFSNYIQETLIAYQLEFTFLV